MSEPKFLTTREVAELLRLGERKVYDLASNDELPVSRVGGKLLFPRQLIEQWIYNSVTWSQGAQTGLPRPVVISGSHDPLLDWALRASGSEIATFFDGSADGLQRLAAGKAIGAGTHLPPTVDGNVRALRLYAPGAPIVLIEWARRQQGLIVKPDAESRYRSLDALRGQPVVTRQPGAGSRRLFDDLLSERGIDREEIVWTSESARTESDVAMAVASGEAVAGFAIESVARQMKLGFIPLTEERYDLAIWRAAYFEPPMQRLWQFCATDTFNERAKVLGGYRMDGFGTVHFNGP